MVDLIIDTNILARDAKRKSAAFRSLSQLITLDEVTLYISDVTRREFTSQLESGHCGSLEKALADIRVAMKAAGGHYAADSELLKSLELNVTAAKDWVEKEFEAWLEQNRVEVIEVADHHGRQAMDSYFKGALPFKARKERDGFPDGFIFEAIKDLAGNAKADQQLHIVTNDNALARASNSLQHVVVLSTLDEFVKLPEMHSARVSEDVLPAIKANEEQVVNFARKKLEAELDHYELTSDEIPSDGNEATISGYDVPEDIGLDWEEAEVYAGGIVAVPFSFDMEILASFYIYKSDYVSLGEDDFSSIGVSEYGNRHYFEGEKHMSVTVTGRISLEVDLSKFTGDSASMKCLVTENSVAVSEIEEIG